MEEYLGIKIDYAKDSYFSEGGLKRLKEGYMLPEETSPQQRFAFVAKAFGSNPEHIQRLYNYMSDFWLSNSTPILSFGKTPKSLPISCFSSFLDDNVKSILEVSNETRMMAVCGGGTAVHINLRPGDKKSSGIIPHLKTYDSDTLAYKQGTSRRGATAIYLRCDHPEIIEFVKMRKPTGGDPDRKCLNLHHGVNFTDDFMQRIYELSTNHNLTQDQIDELDKFPLIDPNTKNIHSYISARELWSTVIGTIRPETGEPYCHFIDTANKFLPDYQKALGLEIKGSNLCIEIELATDALRSLVCCLSSINLEKWDEIKEYGIELFVSDIVEMLDNVIQVFIDKTENIPELAKARYSAMNERAIGIGALGWHSLLQSKMIPFESAMATGMNKSIWKEIKEAAVKATNRLGKERGCNPDFINSGMASQYPEDYTPRNSHLLALAPNAASSYILNTSPSCEPYNANAYQEKGVAGMIIHKNKHLKKLLENKGVDVEKTFKKIVADEGSVKNIDCLSDYEKEVFKTAIELDQVWVIEHAAERQKHICQGQSTNLHFHPEERIEVVHYVHLMAWRRGLKGLYYLRSDSIMKADKVGEKVIRERIDSLEELASRSNPDEICISCQ